MQVRVLRGDPVALSYWLTRNIPLSAGARCALLEAPTAVHRLREACALLRAEAQSQLLCIVCHSQVRLLSSSTDSP